MFGAPANIGSTLNVMPGVYREIRAACARGELARARDVQAQAPVSSACGSSSTFPARSATRTWRPGL